MLKVLSIGAAIAALASFAFHEWIGDIGYDVMAIYLAMAGVNALFRLARS